MVALVLRTVTSAVKPFGQLLCTVSVAVQASPAGSVVTGVGGELDWFPAASTARIITVYPWPGWSPVTSNVKVLGLVLPASYT